MTMLPTYQVIIAGSRFFADYDKLAFLCDNFLRKNVMSRKITILSGGAQGSDTLGEQYAQAKGYGLKRFPADWEQYGKAAGPIRNAQMAKVADALIAFWDGNSRGTQNMIDLARLKPLPFRVVRFDLEKKKG